MHTIYDGKFNTFFSDAQMINFLLLCKKTRIKLSKMKCCYNSWENQSFRCKKKMVICASLKIMTRMMMMMSMLLIFMWMGHEDEGETNKWIKWEAMHEGRKGRKKEERETACSIPLYVFSITITMFWTTEGSLPLGSNHKDCSTTLLPFGVMEWEVMELTV